MTNPLGRRVPTDWQHVDKYPLTAAPTTPTNVPVAIGVSWYTNFDTPVYNYGRWWIGRGDLGTIRGGHCVCLKPAGLTDKWWRYYNQHTEGSCVAQGCSRMMSLLNRKRYDAHWLYHQAQAVDEYADTPPAEGTSVRAALDILRTQGHRPIVRGTSQPVAPAEGIAANRWTTDAQQVLAALGTPQLNHVVILNSWGTDYPARVFIPADTLQRLLNEDGECAIVTDR